MKVALWQTSPTHEIAESIDGLRDGAAVDFSYQLKPGSEYEIRIDGATWFQFRFAVASE